MWQLFVKGHILQQGCKNMFRAHVPSGTHKCLWPFFTRQHLAWLGVSCHHLLIRTIGDFNQRWVGNCTWVRAWSNDVSLARCHILSPALVLMDNDRDVSISVPVGSEKWGLDMLWSVKRGYRTCHCMPLIHFTPLSYANSCQSPLSACVQGCQGQ